MKLLKTAAAVCAQNLRKWQTDQRVWVIGVLLAIMVWIYVDDMRKLSSELGGDMPIWIFPFIYQQFHTKLIYTLPLVLLFCNAPFTDQNQIFVYMRTGRAKWLCGQVLYIITASAFYYLFILAISLLSTIFSGGSLDLNSWGNTLKTLANSNAAQYLQHPFIEVSYTVVKFFTPLQAVWFTFLLSWINAVNIGLIIFLFNLVSGSRFLGILLSSAVIVFSAVTDDYVLPKALPYSPVSWITLNNIDVGKTTTNPTFTYCMLVYLIVMTILAAGIFILGRTKSLDIKED